MQPVGHCSKMHGKMLSGQRLKFQRKLYRVIHSRFSISGSFYITTIKRIDTMGIFIEACGFSVYDDGERLFCVQTFELACELHEMLIGGTRRKWLRV